MKKTIGVLGAGQLGRMLALAGIPLGIDFVFYNTAQEDCVGKLGDIIQGNYQDEQALMQFVERVDCITYENENIPEKTLDFLTQKKPLNPNRQAVQIAQDRIQEKQLFNQLNIPTNRYVAVHSQQDLQQAVKTLGYPFILKTCRGGYDGKGQWRIQSSQDIEKIDFQQSSYGYIAEEIIEFSRELSGIVVANEAGDIKFYDVCENIHRQSILHQTTVQHNDQQHSQLQNYLHKLIDALDYRGVLTVEFFEKDQQLFANEIAPRVHNSGHWTIEGATTSHFENHLRAILDLPLGETTTQGNPVMFNLIGHTIASEGLLAMPHLHLHDYQKVVRAGRKLGHVTSISASSSDLEQLSTFIIGNNQLK